MPNCLITYTGRQFDILNPRPEDVCIEDVEKKVHVAILDSLGMPAPTAEEQRIVDYIDDWLLCLEMETIMNSSSHLDSCFSGVFLSKPNLPTCHCQESHQNYHTNYRICHLVISTTIGC